MISRNAICWLTLCGLLVACHPAHAQRRTRRSPGLLNDPFSTRRSQSQPSSPKERMKSDADQAYRKGDYERTIRLTNTVLRNDPRDHVSLYLRASANVEIGIRKNDGKLIRTALVDVRNAIDVDRGRNAYYYIPYLYGMTSLAVIESNKKHAEVALTVADQALDLKQLKREERGQLLYQRGRTHAHLSRFADAVTDYEAAIRLVNNHLGAYVGLAEVYAADGKHDQALKAYTRTIRAFPDNPLVYNNRGMFLQHQRKFTEAIADFTRAIELDRRYYYAYSNRGFALMESGNPKAAEADYSESLRIESNQPTVRNMRGTARLAQGKTREAVADQQQVTQMLPKDPMARADLGFALFFSADYGGALQAFEKAQELNAEMRHLQPWRYLAMVSVGDKVAVESILGPSLSKNAEERDWIDQILAYLGGASSDEEFLETVQSSDKFARQAQLCEAHYFIGMRNRVEGDMEAATRHFEDALETKALYLSAYRGAQFALQKFTVAGAGQSQVGPRTQ
jgi:tetratricopeptide (TPR) repeat protein